MSRGDEVINLGDWEVLCVHLDRVDCGGCLCAKFEDLNTTKGFSMIYTLYQRKCAGHAQIQRAVENHNG